jgi:hypothetical protein
MIDKKAKRAELETALKKAEDLVTQTTQQIVFLRGGITMLNELITDEESDKAISETPNA